ARFVHSILCISLLASMVGAAPCRLLAQEAAPAAQPTTQSGEAAMPVSAEEAQKNLFRLEGPLVKKAAHALNLSVETTANIFDYLNFLIIVLLIGVPLYKVLPKLLHARGEKVRNDLESARKATTEANARLSAIEAKLSGLDEEIAQIRLQVERESQQDEARIKSTIGEESARVVAAAEQEIASSAAQARRGLRHFAADLAIEQAAKQLIFTPEIDRALIAEFLGDATVTGGQK
ncbi:MAG: ATP synthase F0 subunit B, partial [Terracidiphilus sp.]